MTTEERETIIAALDEDTSGGDPTTEATVDPSVMGSAYLLAKADGILAGIEYAAEVFKLLSERSDRSNLVSSSININDGAKIFYGSKIAEINAPLDVLLTAERVALNLLQRMSGIATMTAHFVALVKGTNAVILDTRKTAPLLRPFDRYAVRCGGGENHRYSLGDMILVKDNHIAANDGNVERVIERLREYHHVHSDIPIEIEVTSLEEFNIVLKYGHDVINRVMFDNFPLEMLSEAVRRNGALFKTEASGGVNLETVRVIAETGVDYISVGALTHSVTGLDISLEIE